MILTIKDLISQVSLYVAIYSKRKQLREPQGVYYLTYKDNVKYVPSVFFRLLAIESLLRAFGLNKECVKEEIPVEYWSNHWDNQSELEFFLEGTFLKADRFSIQGKEKIRKLMHEFMTSDNIKLGIDSARIQPDKVLKELFKFRVNLDEILVSKYINYEGYNYSLGFIQHFKYVNLKVCLDKIDDVLAEIIDVQGLTFTIEESINNFDYPNVDFEKLDTDWLIKTHSDF